VAQGSIILSGDRAVVNSLDFLNRFGLESPVVQAGMGGGVAGAELAGAVSAAGGLGTVGMMAPAAFAAALARARRQAAGRALAANLLAPFLTGAHVRACVEADVSLVVLHGGIPLKWMRRLRERSVPVFVTVGTPQQARRALAGGADGLVVQGAEAGGHLLGVEPLRDALPRVLGVAEGAPVMAAGGVAEAADARRVLDAGAVAAVAGTRFLLTEESAAHEEYKRRVLAAEETLDTMLFGLGWPLRHRVIANAATERWCRADRLGPRPVRLASRLSAPLAHLLPLGALGSLLVRQRPGVPLFTPGSPLVGMPARTADAAALYAGETVVRLHDVIPAAQAVARLAAV
jgi:NAD(P)H-dependent flavin oxidoreductase YrpB (nitropropane dioxygenase family)